MSSSSDDVVVEDDVDDVVDDVEDADDVEEEDDDEDEDVTSVSVSELERIQNECNTMIQLLKNLEREDYDLQCQLEILTREALLCGFADDVVEPPAPKRRRTAPAKKKEEN